MGLFFNLRNGTGQTGVKDVTARAVIAMPLLVAAADGEISAPETTRITNMCTASPIFHAVGPQGTMDLAGDAVNELKAKGATAVSRARRRRFRRNCAKRRSASRSGPRRPMAFLKMGRRSC
jgi:hypothetical protein